MVVNPNLQHTLTLLLVFLLPGIAHAQWEQVKRPYHPGISQIVQIGDTLYATVLGEVLKSADAGMSWQKIYEGYNLIINPLDNGLYVYKNTAYEVYGSTDFGDTWQFLFTPPAGQLVPGFSQDTAFVTQPGALVRKTVNGWDTVFQLPPASGFTIEKAARTENHLWIASSAGSFHSPDLGETWEQLGFTAASLAVLGNTVLFSSCLTDAYLFRTTDFGVTWESDTFAGPRFCQVNATENEFFSINPADGDWNIYSSPDGLSNWDTLYIDSLGFIPRGYRKVDTTVVLAALFGLPQLVNGHWVYHQFPQGSVYPIGGFKKLECFDQYLLATSGYYGHSINQGNSWTTSAISRIPNFIRRSDNAYYGIQSIDDQTFYRAATDGHFEWEALPLDFKPRAMASVGDTFYLTLADAAPSTMYRSTDGGSTWTPSGVGYIKDLYELNGKLLQLGQNGLLSTSDGGATWTTLFDLGYAVSGLDHLYVADSVVYVYNQFNKHLMQSYDGGSSFDTMPVPASTLTPTFFAFRAIGAWNFLTAFNDTLFVKRADDDNWIPLPLPFDPNELGSMFYNFTANDSTFFFPDNLGQIWRLDVKQFGQVKGCVFRDDNGNGAQDTGEPGVQNVLIKSNITGFYDVTDSQGQFNITNNRLYDTLQPLTGFSHYLYSPAEAAVQLSDTVVNCFALQPVGQANDLSVAVAVSGAFRPGFDNVLYVTVTNVGTTTGAGTVGLALDPLLDVVAVQPPASGSNGDTLFWQFSGLEPLGVPLVYRIDVKTQFAQPGTPLKLTAYVTGFYDTDTSNNLVVWNDAVVASYDPNDKLANPGAIPVNDVAGAEIRYTIRFQNTGNIATAFVNLRDTLSPWIDPESIRMLGSSHPCTWRLDKPGILVFTFDPLLLPPASQDETGSQGFVQFGVKLRDGLAVNDTVANKAHIYFDFNPAIVTNTAFTVVSELLSATEPPEPFVLQLYPNPASGQVRIEAGGHEGQAGLLYLFAAGGQLVWQIPTTHPVIDIRLPALPDGLYFVVWQLGDSVFRGRLSIVKVP